MAERKTEELKKHTLLLYAGDYERLGDLHPDVPPALIIRQLVRGHIRRVEDAVPTQVPEVQHE